jgi:hypothetical protein
MIFAAGMGYIARRFMGGRRSGYSGMGMSPRMGRRSMMGW